MGGSGVKYSSACSYLVYIDYINLLTSASFLRVDSHTAEISAREYNFHSSKWGCLIGKHIESDKWDSRIHICKKSAVCIALIVLHFKNLKMNALHHVRHFPSLCAVFLQAIPHHAGFWEKIR